MMRRFVFDFFLLVGMCVLKLDFECVCVCVCVCIETVFEMCDLKLC